MFTYIYTFQYYRFLKSGMLLDFFIKKYVYYLLYIYFFIFNIMFSEKYFIEYNFLRFNKFILYLQIIVDYFNTHLILNGLIIIFNILLIFSIYIYI